MGPRLREDNGGAVKDMAVSGTRGASPSEPCPWILPAVRR